jgi:hypothetical protein
MDDLPPDIEAVALKLALGFIQGAFADLAAAWSLSDRAAADAMVCELERRVTDSFTDFCDELPDEIRDDGILRYAASGLRNAMLLAKERMRDAVAPH